MSCAFKGAQAATRYEVASVVARAVAKLDAEKASKQDLEMLKKLVMEFKDELDALGVKVDKLDKRVAVLEDRLGGWKVTGEFRFDAKWTGENGSYGAAANSSEKFEMERARLHFYKYIDENTTFYGRLNGMDAKWARYQITTKLPYDISFRVGRFNVDWEGDHGFYYGPEVNNDATFGDFDTTGVQFEKTWGMFTATAVIGRNTGLGINEAQQVDNFASVGDEDHTMYALKLHANFNEKFRGGLMGYWLKGMDEYDVVDKTTTPATVTHVTPEDLSTYAVYAGFDFTPNVTLQGIYYWQKFDTILDVEDSPKSWKAQLLLKQDLLKFTSLYVEYAQEDNTFVGLNASGATYSWSGDYGFKRPWGNGTSKIWLIRADQKWNEKWSTFLRYAQFDWDELDAKGNDLDKTKNWTVGVNYQYTPAIAFQLAYDAVKDYYGSADDDHMIRFRTTVNF